MGIIVVFAILVSFHVSYSYDEMAKQVAEKQAEEIKNGTTVQADKPKFDINIFGSLLSDKLSNNFWKFEFSESSPKFAFLFGLVAISLCGYYATSQRKTIANKEYGTSDWEDPRSLNHLSAKVLEEQRIKEVKKNKELTQNAKNQEIEKIKREFGKTEYKKNKYYYSSERIFTKTERICMCNYEINNNTLLLGGSGAGKTRAYFIPNILQGNCSVIITDPKREIRAKTGYFLEKIMNYKVRVLDLDQKKYCDGYNPFYYVHRERDGWEERALTLIDTLIINTKGSEQQKSNDPFWEQGEKLYLQALFFATIEGFPLKEQNFITVNELNKMLEIGEGQDNKDSDLDLFFKIFAKKFGEDHIAVEAFREFRSKASGKTAKSIVIQTVARLTPMRIKEIKRILSKDEMQLDMVGKEKTAIFVTKPPTEDTCNFIAGMFFTQLFQELNYVATVEFIEEQKLPIPVHFYLDEFATTCRIPKFIEILSYARSLGIGITIGIQSFSQLEHIYEKQWKAILDTTHTFLFLGSIRDTDALDDISKMLGKGTFDKLNYSRTKGSHGSSSVSYEKIGRELLDSSEIQRIKKKECLFFVSGYNAFKSIKTDMKKHPNYKYTSDYSSENYFDYVPLYMKNAEEASKKEQKLAEQKRIEEEEKKAQTEKQRAIDKVIHDIIYENQITTEQNSEIIVSRMKSKMLKLEIVTGGFKNSENVDDETVANKTEQEIYDIFNKLENEDEKQEIKLELEPSVVEKAYDIIKDNLVEFASPEENLNIISCLHDNMENLIDIGFFDEIDETNIKSPHGEEDDLVNDDLKSIQNEEEMVQTETFTDDDFELEEEEDFQLVTDIDLTELINDVDISDLPDIKK